jgi:hypothetical protein
LCTELKKIACFASKKLITSEDGSHYHFRNAKFCLLLKEIGSPDEYKIILVLYIHAPMIYKVLGCLVKKMLNAKILLASIKTLANSQLHQNFSRASCLSLVSFLQKSTLIGQRKKMSWAQWAVYGTIFRITARVSEQVLQYQASSECRNLAP